MSKVSITKTKLDTLANTISAKSGVAAPLTLDQMNTAASTMLKPTGTKSITENGTGIDVAAFASVDVNVSGGGGTPTLQTKSKTYTPTTSQQTEVVTADSGYDGLDTVNVTVNAMTTGTAGTPTATKGTVSNHAISVTPSVTNTAGYISGGTNTGTAVTVSASELVSGSETKTENGTYDVTNLAELIVNVSGSAAKTATGTFTGNGSRSVAITCAFEPDLVYWTSDPGTSASSGTVAGLIARGMMASNRYRNNSTTNSANLQTPITGMNTGGSSYNFRATYADGKVTIYCFSSNARSLFTNSRTYTYTFIKWTS